MLLKSFICLAIIVVIAILNNADLAHAKSHTMDNKLTSKDFLPENLVNGQLHTASGLRYRRQTAPGESDIPKEPQNNAQLNRAKRQIQSPPGDMPMPPM